MNDTQSKPNHSPQSEAERELQREFRVRLAALTGGLAPEDYGQAWWDWFLGLA